MTTRKILIFITILFPEGQVVFLYATFYDNHLPGSATYVYSRDEGTLHSPNLVYMLMQKCLDREFLLILTSTESEPSKSLKYNHIFASICTHPITVKLSKFIH